MLALVFGDVPFVDVGDPNGLPAPPIATTGQTTAIGRNQERLMCEGSAWGRLDARDLFFLCQSCVFISWV